MRDDQKVRRDQLYQGCRFEAERAVFWRRRAFLSHQTFDRMDESIWKKAFYCVKTGRIEASQLPRFALA